MLIEQLGRARLTPPGSCGLRAGGPVDGVVQHFRRQPAGQGVRVVHVVVLVPLVRDDRVLVGPRFADQLDHVPRVEAALDELLRQAVEQLRIARRVAGADVVDRLDDADAEQVAPTGD